MIKGTCHCGQVSYEYRDIPDFAISCNCSICRRLGTRWIYTSTGNVTLRGETLEYIHGDRELAFHTCSRCGSTSHWISTDISTRDRIAVNLMLADPHVIAQVPLRHFDGADSWDFID